ncbi:hypothetical protein BX667DRAFT_494697 [Coemansia mojavensis]|nr:hypothetical protein BX667DRAFT_494697 [Coemansia mojavensis]
MKSILKLPLFSILVSQQACAGKNMDSYDRAASVPCFSKYTNSTLSQRPLEHQSLLKPAKPSKFSKDADALHNIFEVILTTNLDGFFQIGFP